MMTQDNTRPIAPAATLLKFNLRDAGTVIGLLIIVATFSFLSPVFFTVPNLLNILQQSSINAIIALGMTLVIISGGIDLSVGPTAALSAVLGATLMVSGVPVPLAIMATLGVGALCGVFSGTLVAYAGLQPFIVTLGGLSLFRALALIFTGGNPIFGIPLEFRMLINSSLLGIPTPIIIVLVIATLLWVLMNKTPLGEYILAVGGNEEAARVAGVPVRKTKVTVFIISGVLASLASLILIGRLGAAEPTMGNLWELDAIAAAAIGGASLMGGKGSIIGTIVGAIILGALRNGLTLLNIQAFYQLLATGVIIIIAMLIDRATRGK
ncbi:ABC transporter permease [Serratia odorifera]|jgi:ribose transport system permease protein|uniref:Branched-chain amino acid ABC transporter, permease protein n=2 Tax=Serratia odorifera TaxID=618 RepID=D4E6B4_SEROD|nr:ribose ABC transporter permease [Serratia odorifera]EFE94843.1 branched-chain amino acid ABC transporter, permease protein [Serratia odorifera DSM 4582]MBJ2064871.1 ribose ABC transporter permease [Serratia odorifera]PNK89461.1 ribose ABC transporter permease [Serratia odorifera]RII70953.1 ribose ABC transporter permease [Serratia odorifera]VDZ63276.1 Ribose transport system permease protein rbsC [Serratia odorifera]